jgi:hypothetical protein
MAASLVTSAPFLVRLAPIVVFDCPFALLLLGELRVNWLRETVATAPNVEVSESWRVRLIDARVHITNRGRWAVRAGLRRALRR